MPRQDAKGTLTGLRRVGAIADSTEQLCQSGAAIASVKYASAIAKAMQRCLDKIREGDLAGDAQELCFGR